MFKRADGEPLAAAQEVRVQACLESEQIVLLPSAYGVAQAYAAYNSDYLAARKIYPRITNIWVDQTAHKAYVRLLDR